jgi:hypothetical protein
VAEPTTFSTDVTVRGTLRATAVALPAACVGNANVNPSDPVESANLRHRHKAGFRQAHGTAAAAERRVVHRARGAGTILAAAAGVSVACTGNATVSVDVLKNNVSVLSAPVVLDNTNAAYAAEAAAVATAAYAAGDVIEQVVTVSAGTGVLGQGLFLDLDLDEGAA